MRRTEITVHRPHVLATTARIFHYLSLFLILRIETFKYTSNHQIFDIKSRTSLMYNGQSAFVRYTRKFASLTCANSKTVAYDKEIFSKGKPIKCKRVLDKSVDGRDQKKTI